MTSASTGTHDRNSGHYAGAQQQQGDVKTKIVEDPEDEEEGRSESGRMGNVVEGMEAVVGYFFLFDVTGKKGVKGGTIGVILWPGL
ncbi:MAG: hypothetical protein Q9214_007577 [Letrouitia sp. 1 TL-2023]